MLSKASRDSDGKAVLDEATHDREEEAALSEPACGKDGKAMLEEATRDREGLGDTAHDKEGEVVSGELVHNRDGEVVLGEVAHDRDGEAMLGEATRGRTHVGIKHGFPRGDIIRSNGNLKSCHGALGIWDVMVCLP